MNLRDFEIWEKYHRAAFPAHGKWLDEQGTLTRGHWSKALDDVGLADAKRATDLLLRGDEEPAKGFGEVPQRVRKIARGLSSERLANQKSHRHQVIDGQDTFRCLICRDHGAVEVWHPNAMEFMRSLEYEPDWDNGGAVIRERAMAMCEALPSLLDVARDMVGKSAPWRLSDDPEWLEGARRGMYVKSCVVRCSCAMTDDKANTKHRFNDKHMVKFDWFNPRELFEFIYSRSERVTTDWAEAQGF